MFREGSNESHTQPNQADAQVPTMNLMPSAKTSTANTNLWTVAIALLAMLAASGNLFIGALPVSPTSVAILATIVIALAQWTANGLRIDTTTIFAIITILAMMPGVLNAPSTEYAQTKVLQTFITIGIAWTCAQLIKTDSSRVWFHKWVAVGGIFAAGAVLLAGEYDTFTGRVSYSQLNPIGIGRMTSYAGIILAILGLYKFPRVNFLWLAGGATLFGVAAATGSRAPLGAAIAALLVVLALRAGNLLSRLLAVIGVMATIAASFGLTQFENGGGGSRLQLASLTGRDLLWRTSIETFFESPFGVGIGNLRSSFPAGALTKSDVYSHNLFLEAATEGGVILLAWVAIFVAVALTVSLKRLESLGAQLSTALVVATLVNAQFSSDFVGNRLMWVMLFMAVAEVSPRQSKLHKDPFEARRKSEL